ncbi:MULTISPECIES: hypothetical protein [Actinosynnema]|uniref:hypothetical protein n=1 Tax=Actinosynnema TaxID=40566 RepID=UPI0020A5F478|nr:hypothetical protein [Actinosynnema pretiosum]MCP2092418.1 hypothetical protein [Actinosynnema pretiosum]
MSQQERQEQAGRALDWVGGKLLTVAPPGWAVMDLKVSFAADVEDFTFATVLADGSFVPVEMPVEVRDPFVDLRHLLHEPGAGTWFSIRFTMTPPDYYRVDLNFDVDPVWDPPIDPAVLADDLLRWPRSPENTPRWALEALGIEPSALSDRAGREEQVEQVKRIAKQLRQVLPPGWAYAQVRFREIGEHAEVGALVQDVAGVMTRWDPPRAVAQRFRELSAMSLRGEHGPWDSAVAELFSDGREKVSMNRADQPDRERAEG